MISQISFLDDSGNVRKDCISSGVLHCYLCNFPIPRYSETRYFIAVGSPKRICERCYEESKLKGVVR